MLAVDMSGDAVKAKNGSMVAYDGQMAFKKMSGGGEGMRGFPNGPLRQCWTQSPAVAG